MTEQQFSPISAADSSTEPAVDLWRSEVQSRLARYKTRRGRRIEGAFSMRFPFPADEAVEPVATSDTVFVIAEPLEGAPKNDLIPEATAGNQQVGEPQIALSGQMEKSAVENEVPAEERIDLVLAVAPEPEPFVDTVQRPRPKRKVIAFPKHLSIAPEGVYRLADPVTTESPRILDVPEELEAIPTTPFLDGLQLDRVGRADEARDREHVDLPFRAVRVSQRVLAGLVDVVVAGVGVAVFAAVAFKILSNPPVTKPMIGALLVAAGLLWSVYQYLLVVYAGQTIGMIAAKIRLRTFKGTAPTLRQRRHRVLGFYFSALSLGMGLMWMLVDVDALCWHDRLSQTYLADRQP